MLTLRWLRTMNGKKQSLNFERNLQKICKNLRLAQNDTEVYKTDAQQLAEAIIKCFCERDFNFKNTFKQFTLTGGYLSGLQLDRPDEFDVYLTLELPFAVTATPHSTLCGCVTLQCSCDHWLLDHNCVNREKLQTWIAAGLRQLTSRRLRLLLGQRLYDCCCPRNKCRSYGMAQHTVVATARNSEQRVITLHFVPVLEFERHSWPLSAALHTAHHSWIAVPQAKRFGGRGCDAFAFMACAPHWQRSIFTAESGLVDVLQLVRALCSVNDMPLVTSDLLKSAFLIEVDRKSEDFWNNPLPELLIYMLEQFRNYFGRARLPFDDYLNEREHHLQRLSTVEISIYRYKFDKMVYQLKSAQNGDYHILTRIFRIQ